MPARKRKTIAAKPSDGARARMVAGAVAQLAKRGLEGTSFSSVLAITGAPRGSIYHHFPDGKDQLVAAAVDAAGGRALALLSTWQGKRAEDVAAAFLDVWRELLVRSGLQAGCAVLAVTIATDSPDLLARTANVFRSWRAELAGLLREGGLRGVDAQRMAASLVAGSEGAVALCRAEQSLEPLELVREQLLGDVRRLARK